MRIAAVRDVRTKVQKPVGASHVERSGARPLLAAPGQVRFPGVPECATGLGQGPCLRLSCRYHVAHPERGGRTLRGSRDCALTVANEGPHTLEEVAQVLGMSRERVRQLEEAAIAKLKNRSALKKLYCEIA